MNVSLLELCVLCTLHFPLKQKLNLKLKTLTCLSYMLIQTYLNVLIRVEQLPLGMDFCVF